MRNNPFPLLSDASLEVFKQYRAYDDFEKQPQIRHGTFLIDIIMILRMKAFASSAHGMRRFISRINHEPFEDLC